MISDNAKLRLRALLAFLPLTDFTVGILVQATFAAMLIMLLPDETRVYCVWQVLRYASIFVRCFLALPLDFFLSAERYIAMNNPFFYITWVGHRGSLAQLVASALAWLLSQFQTVLLFLMSKTMVLRGTAIFHSVSLAVIFFCHVTVFFQNHRHEKQLAAQQTTLEAKEEFEKNTKAIKLTFIILAALSFNCFLYLEGLLSLLYQSLVVMQLRRQF